MLALSPDDETYLDGIFDAAVASYSSGKSFAVDPSTSERPHLAESIARTVALAREVSFGAAAAADAAPPAVPAFPGYELLGEIGRGGAGVVYRARQAHVGRVVALKILAPALVPSRRARDRFAAEARALGRIAHPNVVRIHDVVVGDEACALAMEYVEGTTLADAAANARGGLDLGLVVRVGAAVARALAAVHAAGLVHRDVKPANVVLRGDGAPVLVDFGLARDVEGPAHTATGEFLGTTAYASPEQIRGERVDHRTDLFALGVTLFVAAAGRPPFRAATAAETLRRIEAGDGETLRRARRGVPEDLCAVVEKALEPDPARRYATAAEMADDLERVARWEPVSARRSSWRRRVARRLRRHRRSAVVAALAAAATLIAASLWIASWRADLARPELFRERVRAARRDLVDPDAQMRLFVALNDQGAEALSRGLFAGESIERALASYDAALGLREDVIVRLERETVATAGALLRRDAAVRPPQSWTSAAPLAAAVALAWERDRRPGPFEIPPQTSPEDLRCTGLLAYLCSDVAGAIRSWGPLESDVAFDDPLIAAALGSAWLALDRPALAAPRLARAVREFPESAPLRFDLADALIRVGDLTRGEAELRAAAPYFGDRPACVRDRPAADLALAKGERAEARARYDAAQRSPTTSLHHAAFLSSEGEFAEAFERAADAYAPFPRIPRFRRFMLDLLEPAFGALDRSARLDVLCEAATSGETYAPLYAIGASLR